MIQPWENPRSKYYWFRRRVPAEYRKFGMPTEIKFSLEEERRLLYVAMTRGKDDLHLVVPQRFFVQGQRSKGDRHVYASRTRFIPEKLLALFERTSWPAASPGTARGPSQGPRIDVGARVRGMWR